MADRHYRDDESRHGRTTKAFGRDDDWNEAERERPSWPRDDRGTDYGRREAYDGPYAGDTGIGFGGAGPRQGAGRGVGRRAYREAERQYRTFGPPFPDDDDRRGYDVRRAGYGHDRDRLGRDYEDSGRHRDDERGFLEKAGDEVASWFGDEDAERRRWADKHRGHGPKGYTRSSDRIREDVCDRLTDDAMVDARNIEVSVSGTEVTLSGLVASRAQRRRAEALADAVPGVTHVQNNTRVEDPTSVTDATTTNAIKGRTAATNR